MATHRERERERETHTHSVSNQSGLPPNIQKQKLYGSVCVLGRTLEVCDWRSRACERNSHGREGRYKFTTVPSLCSRSATHRCTFKRRAQSLSARQRASRLWPRAASKSEPANAFGSQLCVHFRVLCNSV